VVSRRAPNGGRTAGASPGPAGTSQGLTGTSRGLTGTSQGLTGTSQGLTEASGRWTGRIHVDQGSLEAPLGWDGPGWVVLGSLCDLFHPGVDLATIETIFRVVRSTSLLTYRVLTKRAKRLLHLGNEGLAFPDNLWVGVSVESDAFTWRADDLLRVNAPLTWVAVEPILGPVPSLEVGSLGWVVCAAESGSGSRPVDPRWVRDLRDRCLASGVPFRYGSLGDSFEEFGSLELPLLDGRAWDQVPIAL
jgi:protein gp37